jgi:hypothetical protein
MGTVDDAVLVTRKEGKRARAQRGTSLVCLSTNLSHVCEDSDWQEGASCSETTAVGMRSYTDAQIDRH